MKSPKLSLTFSHVTPLVTAGESGTNSGLLPDLPGFARVRSLVGTFNKLRRQHLANKSAVLRFHEEICASGENGRGGERGRREDDLGKYGVDTSDAETLPLRRLLHDSVARRFWTAGKNPLISDA
jgi:hypothetical protein